MRTVTYPDWAEKYRGKGRTIRKVRNGYGLYQCTSVYVSVQIPVRRYMSSAKTGAFMLS